jgi:hypothetical protein
MLVIDIFGILILASRPASHVNKEDLWVAFLLTSVSHLKINWRPRSMMTEKTLHFKGSWHSYDELKASTFRKQGAEVGEGAKTCCTWCYEVRELLLLLLL